MAVIKGNELMLFLNGESIAFATTHTLETTSETQDTATAVATKDGNSSIWADPIVTGQSWSCTSENLIANEQEGKSFEDLMELKLNATEVELILAEKSSTSSQVPEGGWTPKTGKGYKGKAIITSISINAATSDNATFSVTFTGKGALTKVSA